MSLNKSNIKDIKNYRPIILFCFLVIEVVTISYATSASFFFYLLIFAILIPIVIIAKFKLSQLIGKAGLFHDSSELFFSGVDIIIATVSALLRFKNGGLETCLDTCNTTPFPEAIFSVILPTFIIVTISVFINLAGYKSGKAKS